VQFEGIAQIGKRSPTKEIKHHHHHHIFRLLNFAIIRKLEPWLHWSLGPRRLLLVLNYSRHPHVLHLCGHVFLVLLQFTHSIVNDVMLTRRPVFEAIFDWFRCPRSSSTSSSVVGSTFCGATVPRSTRVSRGARVSRRVLASRDAPAVLACWSRRPDALAVPDSWRVARASVDGLLDALIDAALDCDFEWLASRPSFEADIDFKSSTAWIRNPTLWLTPSAIYFRQWIAISSPLSSAATGSAASAEHADGRLNIDRPTKHGYSR